MWLRLPLWWWHATRDVTLEAAAVIFAPVDVLDEARSTATAKAVMGRVRLRFTAPHACLTPANALRPPRAQHLSEMSAAARPRWTCDGEPNSLELLQAVDPLTVANYGRRGGLYSEDRQGHRDAADAGG